MPLVIVAHLIAHPRKQDEPTTIFQLGLQLALQAQQDMPSPAPVVGQVPGTVLDHPYTGTAKLTSPPIGGTRLARMGDGLDSRPIRRTEGDSRKVHGAVPCREEPQTL